MFSKFSRLALFFIAAWLVNTGAKAQINTTKSPDKTPVTANCPTALTMKAAQLYGSWTVAFSKPPGGLPANATMLLEQHAEFSDSLAGVVSRNLAAANGSATTASHAAKAFLAGDLEDGVLLLDESSDNLSITGTWNGEIVNGSCGKVFKGSWKDTSSSAIDDAPDVPFTLTRRP